MEKLFALLNEVNSTGPRACTPKKLSELRDELAAYITHLIQHDFSQLVALLYRVDVSEKKLKALLANHTDTNTAIVITDLLIERQLQKLADKRQQEPDADIPEDERW